MATYTIDQFSQVVGKSVRTVRRYIEKGTTPQGIKWRKPRKKKGQYIFTESDVDQWTNDKGLSGQKVTSAKMSGQSSETLFLLEKLTTLEKEYRETLLLQGREKTALEKDLEHIKEKYTQTATEKQHIENQLREMESEKSQLEGQLSERLKQAREEKERLQSENDRLKQRSLWDILLRRG